MFNLYNVLLSVHILAVVAWVGGGMTLVHLMARLGREREPLVIGRLLGAAAVIGQRVFGPSSLIIVAVGFGMIANHHLHFDLWLILGLIGWLLTAVHGAAVLGRQSEKLSQDIASGAADAQAIDTRLRTFMLHANAELAILVLIIFDMVIKPGT